MGGCKCLNTASPGFKYLVLICVCMLTFCTYLVFDVPSSICNQLLEYMDITKEQYQMIFSIYDACSFVSVLISGVLLDKTGLRLGLSIFVVMVNVGQVLFGLSVQLKVYWLMLAGWVLFGLSGGSICLCQKVACTKYFAQTKSLATAFGATVTVSRCGSVFTFFVVPLICDAIGVSGTVWTTVAICAISIVFVLGFDYLDSMYGK